MTGYQTQIHRHYIHPCMKFFARPRQKYRKLYLVHDKQFKYQKSMVWSEDSFIQLTVMLLISVWSCCSTLRETKHHSRFYPYHKNVGLYFFINKMYLENTPCTSWSRKQRQVGIKTGRKHVLCTIKYGHSAYNLIKTLQCAPVFLLPSTCTQAVVN